MLIVGGGIKLYPAAHVHPVHPAPRLATKLGWGPGGREAECRLNRPVNSGLDL